MSSARSPGGAATVAGPPRRDEIDWFDRISDGKTALWMAGATTWLFHATVDGKVAVCSNRILVDRERDLYPRIADRSNDLMTCESCAKLVKRRRMPPWSLHHG